MFIANSFSKDNWFGKYLIGSLLVFIASSIGQVPFLVLGYLKLKTQGKGIYDFEKEIYTIFDLNTTLFLMLISFVFAIGGLIFVVNKLHNMPFLKIITGREKLDWKRFFYAFWFWFILSAIIIFASIFIDSSEIELQFQLVPFLLLCLISFLLIPIQTSTEELIFRGYLMQGFFNLAKNKWFPLLMTSVIFGVLHIFNPEAEKMGNIVLVYYIGTGLFLGIITLMDNGTELALGFHAANNIVSALIISSDYSVLRTDAIFKDLSDPSVGFEILFPILLYGLLIYIFAKKYKWNNWKEKLIGKINIKEEENGYKL